MDAPFIIDDPGSERFRLNRRVLVDPDILETERRRIFDRCWIYLGHDSEIPEPGDFRTRQVAGRPVLFVRDREGRARAFLNTCRHRGTMVCRERRRQPDPVQPASITAGPTIMAARSPTCRGRSPTAPLSTGPNSRSGEVPALEAYRGFWFAHFGAEPEPLADYLAGAREYLDLVVDQSPDARLEIVAGTQEYDIRANWKLLVENSFDDYHLHATHATYPRIHEGFGRLGPPAQGADDAGARNRQAARQRPCRGRQRQLPRPADRRLDPALRARGAKAEIESIRGELVARLGEDRARRVADTNRNLVVFPNLVINDGSAVTVRTFWPISVDRMRVTAWALGPVEESETSRGAAPRQLPHLLRAGRAGGRPNDVEGAGAGAGRAVHLAGGRLVRDLAPA